MNRKEFVAELAEKTGFPKKDVDASVSAAIELLTEAMKKGDSVQFIGFGTFSVTEKPERTARNPRTGEDIRIAACRAPKFKPGKSLKDALK